MEDFSLLEEYLRKEIEKIDSTIQLENEKMETFESLKSIINQLKENPNDIDMFTFRKCLSLYLSLEEVEIYCERLQYIKDIYESVYDPELSESSVVKDSIQYINDFIEKIEIFSKNNSSKYGRLSFLVKENLKRKEVLESYLKLIKDGSLARPLSKEETNMLFDELKKSNLEKNDLLELIKKIIKHNLEHSKSVKKIKDGILDSKVEKNVTIVHEILNAQAEPKEEQVEITSKYSIPSVDTIEFSPEEQETFNKMNSLIARKGGLLTVDIEILCKRLSNDLSLDERVKLYVKNNKFNWELIAEDLKTNLIPQILVNKEQVFEIFKYILNCVEQEEIIQKQLYTYRKGLNEQLEKIQSVFEHNKDVIHSFSELSEQETRHVTYIDSMVKSNNIDKLNEDDYNRIYEVTFMLSLYPEFLGLIDMIKDTIMSETITQDDYEFLINEVNSLLEKNDKFISEEKERVDEKNKTNNPVEDPVEEPDVSKLDVRKYDIKSTKNIILMLKNNDGEFCAEVSIDKTRDKQNYLIKRDALSRTIDIFQKLYYNSEYIINFNESRGNHGDGKVKYTSRNGNEGYDEELKPRRCWPAGKGRVCYIEIPICFENLRKLHLAYNNPNFLFDDYSKQVLVIMLVESGVVMGASHSDYDAFNKSMRNNKDYIRKVKALFANPNTPVEVLTEIIDESSEFCKKYTTSEGLSPEGRSKK